MKKKLAILVVLTCFLSGTLAVCYHFRIAFWEDKISTGDLAGEKDPKKGEKTADKLVKKTVVKTPPGVQTPSDKKFLLRNSNSKNFLLDLDNLEIRIHSPKSGRYIANYFDKFIEVDASDSENIKIINNEGLVAQGFKVSKTVKLFREGKNYLWVRFNSNYIRMRLKFSWELKRNRNLWKLYRNGFEVGKVKLYSTGKLAIKDSFNSPVGYAKNVGKLSAGAAIFLNKFISLENQIAVFLLFLALDK